LSEQPYGVAAAIDTGLPAGTSVIAVRMWWRAPATSAGPAVSDLLPIHSRLPGMDGLAPLPARFSRQRRRSVEVIGRLGLSKRTRMSTDALAVRHVATGIHPDHDGLVPFRRRFPGEPCSEHLQVPAMTKAATSPAVAGLHGA